MQQRWITVRTEMGQERQVGQLRLTPVARVVQVRLGGERFPLRFQFARARPVAVRIVGNGQARRLRVPAVRQRVLAIGLVITAAVLTRQRWMGRSGRLAPDGE